MPVSEMRVKLANDLFICGCLLLSLLVGPDMRKTWKERTGLERAPLVDHAFPVDSLHKRRDVT
jgi:hypothetical protein